jgi:hypothetical protein
VTQPGKKQRTRAELLEDVQRAMFFYGFVGLERVAAEIDYRVDSLERQLYKYGREDLIRRLIPDRIPAYERKLLAASDARHKNRKRRPRGQVRKAA